MQFIIYGMLLLAFNLFAHTEFPETVDRTNKGLITVDSRWTMFTHLAYDQGEIMQFSRTPEASTRAIACVDPKIIALHAFRRFLYDQYCAQSAWNSANWAIATRAASAVPSHGQFSMPLPMNEHFAGHDRSSSGQPIYRIFNLIINPPLQFPVHFGPYDENAQSEVKTSDAASSNVE